MTNAVNESNEGNALLALHHDRRAKVEAATEERSHKGRGN